MAKDQMSEEMFQPREYTLSFAPVGDLDKIIRYALVPKPVEVIYNDPATVVIWEDGEKTVVKCSDGDAFDPEKGLLLCIAKRFYGNSGRFNNVLRKWAQ